MRVILENEESEKISDIFLLLFFFTRSKDILFIKRDLSTLTLKRKDALFSFLKQGGQLCKASIIR